jgi:hypothetical protein
MFKQCKVVIGGRHTGWVLKGIVGNCNMGLCFDFNGMSADFGLYYRLLCSVDCITERCCGCFSGLWVVGGSCRKLEETVVCSRYS